MKKEDGIFAYANSGLRQSFEQLPDIIIRTLPDHYLEQLFIMKQQSELDLRAPGKYDKRFLGLHVLSNFNPLSRIFHFVPSSGFGMYSASEVPYRWGRAVDDVVDGDAPVPIANMSVGEWIRSLKEYARTGAHEVPKGITVEFMLKRALVRLEGIHSGVDVRGEMINFLDAMEREYDRRVNRLVLTRDELEVLNRNSFGSPHTIILVSLRSKARGEDIDELGQIQGRIQALRDIHPELAKGLCNIPAEVIGESGLILTDLEADSHLFDKNTTLQEWKQREIDECGVLMGQLKVKQRNLDLPARLYVGYLMNEIEHHISNLRDNNRYL